MAIPQKPKLLYEITIRRGRYFRRFAWWLLAGVAALGALVALDTAAVRGMADESLLNVGKIVALIAAILFGLRALFHLIGWLRRRNETLKLFDKGLVWTKRSGTQQYSWSSLNTYREAGRGIYLGKRPLFQWGAHRLTMNDGKTLKITGVYGDLRKLGSILRKPAARVTGAVMGRTLREEEPVRLSRHLTVWPGGVEAGKLEIPWSEVDVRLKSGRLIIYRLNKAGKFQPVKRYNPRRLDNVGGFMEVATATIRNHQRERFEKR